MLVAPMSNIFLLQDANDEEVELDIDELTNDVLNQLLEFIKKNLPGLPASKHQTRVASPPPKPSRPTKPKKNKPMSKVEQEARITELKGKLKGFNNTRGYDASPEPSESNDFHA
jgi:bromodomain-containing factor 1